MNFFKKTLLLTSLFSTTIMNAQSKGINLSNLDTTVDPRTDFYEYACGGWRKANPLPDDKARYGVFDKLAEDNREQLKVLFDDLAKSKHEKGTIAQKVTDLYSLAMDSVRRNEEGAKPIQIDLAKVKSMTKDQLNEMIVWMHTDIGSPFFSCGVDADFKNSDLNTMYVGQPGLGLPNRDYYLENTPDNKKVQAKYKEYLEKLFILAGYSKADAKRASKNVYKLEYQFAQNNWDNVRLRDYPSQYNVYDTDKMQKDFPNIVDWAYFFKQIGIKDMGQVIVGQPDVLKKVNDIMGKMSLQEIKDYFACQIIRSASGALSDEFQELNFDMYSRTIAGIKTMEPRWKRALNAPNSLLGEAVGELYVERFFAGESKIRMLKLIHNLRSALAEHISHVTWMSDSTKINALVKLNTFTVKVGYPDKWKDYSAINIDTNISYWENLKKAIIWNSADNISKYGKPVDKDEWAMTPQTVNAYYNPTTNEICFPAAILQPPFFDINADDASNYGAIGVVIGHEMTHGFDDQGRNFDQNGNMQDWWTAKDAEAFKSLTGILADQYSSIIVREDTQEHANGEFTLGENIADHGGLNVSYSAFKKTVQGQSDEKIDGLTPDQRFYIAYASVWASNIRNEEITRRTKTDPHSLGRWRVNAALKNIAPFYQAFGITEGDKMYLDPSKRVTIW